MECRGCKDKGCGEAICWTAAGGVISTAVGGLFGADVAIILGMVACLVALVWWGVMCVTEGNPETVSKTANGESDRLTGEMKF
jgi:hypothetical protein